MPVRLAFLWLEPRRNLMACIAICSIVRRNAGTSSGVTRLLGVGKPGNSDLGHAAGQPDDRFAVI